MPRPRRLLSCVTLVIALALCGPGAALASSAGDQQYVDPLAQNHTGSPGSGSSSSGSASSGSGSSASSDPSGSSTGNGQATASSATGTTAATTAAAQSSAATLPRTGFSAYLSAVIGLALLGAGLGVRRALRSA